MVNNSANINKTKESLNSEGQQFYQYHQNKESLNSDGQQFCQYKQNEQPSQTIEHNHVLSFETVCEQTVLFICLNIYI